MDKVIAYNVGVCHASACCDNDATKVEIEDAVNREHPTGLSSRWALSPSPVFVTGERNPCPCDQHPVTRKHILLVC